MPAAETSQPRANGRVETLRRRTLHIPLRRAAGVERWRWLGWRDGVGGILAGVDCTAVDKEEGKRYF